MKTADSPVRPHIRHSHQRQLQGLALSVLPRSVTIGGLARPDLLAKLEEADVQLNEFGRALFSDERFTTEPVPRRVEVHGTTVAELGLATGGTWSQVLEKANLRGWSVCPLELAVHLRLQWRDQPAVPIDQPPTKHRAPLGSATVATQAPPDEQDIPWGFYLRHLEDGLWLRGYRSWSGHIKSAHDFLVFMRSTNAA